jgi:lauroyl/myristoyl acyltransferase
MLTEVHGDNSGTPTATPTPAAGRPAWWARLLARVPLSVLYGLASVAGWLTYRFFPYRRDLVRENLAKAFPAFDEGNCAR